jgi:hypothetical protein
MSKDQLRTGGLAGEAPVLETLTGALQAREKMSEDCAGVRWWVRRQRFHPGDNRRALLREKMSGDWCCVRRVR